MRIELRQLQHFLLAAECEHFGKAAERARLAQPSLSRSIAALERLTGAPLFDRVGRGVRLTPAGRALADDARRILGDIDSAVARARRLATGTHGRLRIGFVESAAWGGEVPSLLGQVRARLPDVALELLPMSSIDARAALAEGRLECAFAYAQQDGTDDNFLRSQVRVDRVVAALPKNHRLATRKNLRLADLSGEAFVLFPRAAAPAYWTRLLDACAKGGLVPSVVQEGGNDATMLTLVAAGIGASLVNSVARWRKPEGVALVDIADLALDLRLDLLWQADARDPALARFVALAKGLFAWRAAVPQR
jgi:DNA-binding transcriptional LysR family regulator